VQQHTRFLFVLVCKDANCVANAQIKYSYLVLAMQKQKHNLI